MENVSEVKRLAKNTGLIAIGNLGAKLISFILLPLYTSILTPSEYGIYDFIITLSFFITPVVSMLIFESLFRFLIEANSNNDEAKTRDIISSSVFINLISIVLYIVVSIIIYLIFKINFIPILTAYVISNIIYTFLVSLLRGINKIKAYAIYSSIKNSVQVILSCISITLLKLGINGLLYSTIISSLVISILVIIQFQLWKYFTFKTKNLKSVKKLIKYSIPLIPDSISNSIIGMSDRIVVKQFVSTEANGLYSISHKFPSIIEVIYHFFITAWNESASRVYETDKSKMTDYYQGLYEFTKRIVISKVMCLIAIMPILFRILIRGDYIESFNYVPLLLMSQMLSCISGFYSGILIANKDTKRIANSTILSAIINIILNVVLVFKFGVYGVLFATFISNVVMVILRKYNSSKYIKLKENVTYYIFTVLFFIIVNILYSFTNLYKILFNILVSILFFIITNRTYIKLILSIFKKRMKIGDR